MKWLYAARVATVTWNVNSYIDQRIETGSDHQNVPMLPYPTSPYQTRCCLPFAHPYRSNTTRIFDGLNCVSTVFCDWLQIDLGRMTLLSRLTCSLQHALNSTNFPAANRNSLSADLHEINSTNVLARLKNRLFIYLCDLGLQKTIAVVL